MPSVVVVLGLVVGCSSPEPAVAPAPGSASAPAPAPEAEPEPASTRRPIGPYSLPFAPARAVYFAVPPRPAPGARLLANLHGLCNPPGYSCGYWVGAGSARGFLVCPTGNATCGAGADAPPTWREDDAAIDRDLEASIAAVDAAYPGEMTRDGAVLTGFSRGAYAAGRIAVARPGLWPYLVLVEADVPLDAGALRRAGVRGVAMLAGEIGAQVAGERRTVTRLVAAGFRARLWVMPRAGHYYSADIDALMGEAVDWLVTPDSPAGAAAR